MGKKSDAAEIDRRIHAVVKLLSSAKTSSYVCRYARDEWGVSQATAERYMKRAREIIRADYSVERSEFLGTRLALLDEIIEASIRRWIIGSGDRGGTQLKVRTSIHCA